MNEKTKELADKIESLCEEYNYEEIDGDDLIVAVTESIHNRMG